MTLYIYIYNIWVIIYVFFCGTVYVFVILDDFLNVILVIMPFNLKTPASSLIENWLSVVHIFLPVLILNTSTIFLGIWVNHQDYIIRIQKHLSLYPENIYNTQ